MTLPGKTAMACKTLSMYWRNYPLSLILTLVKNRMAIVLPRCSKSVSDGHWRQFTLQSPEDLELLTRALLHRKLFSDHVIYFRSWRHEALLYPPDVQGILSDLINQAQARASWVSVTNNYLIKYTCFILNVDNRWLDHLYAFYILPIHRSAMSELVLELKVRGWYGLRLLLWL